MRYLFPLTLSVCAALFAGCSEDQPVDSPSGANAVSTNTETGTTTVATDNKHCPIMGGEVTADGGRVEWNGNTIGFCCPGCIEEFQEMTDAEKTEALAKAEKDHDDHDHGTSEAEPANS